MTDFLGPSQATPNNATARPPDGRVFGEIDTWLKDCTSPNSSDGTPVTAAMLNGILANLRALVRGNGDLGIGGPVVPEANSDLLLLTAILHLIQRRVTNIATITGTANALIASVPLVPAELIDGFEITGLPIFDNTAAGTLNFLGTRSIVLPTGGNLSGGEMKAGSWADWVYSAALDKWLLKNPIPKGAFSPVKFTSNGTFTPTTGLVYVEAWGGGAAGRNVSGSSYTAGQGGGAGEYRRATLRVPIGVGITITVGQGAAAGTNGNGTNSTFGSYITAKGAIGTAGGTAGTGGVGFDGGPGSSGFSNGNVTGAIVVIGSGGVPFSAGRFGGGGAGGDGGPSGNPSGRAGQNGLVLVTEIA